MKELKMRVASKVAALVLLSLSALSFAGQVDINTADAKTISAELNGVGLAKAKAIVEYREKHGPFRTADDLTLVKGIGEKTLERNRSDIKVSEGKKK
ncbi:MAG: helix-hairpin-helix domain-containing protein [Woeseiaceae bacterium]|nr:helix-hairpin-helix domain-containing protein [Woeseiaceae bacterium]